LFRIKTDFGQLQEDDMSTYDTRSGPARRELSSTPTWGRILLGASFLFAGLAVLADVTLATVVSAKIIGVIAMLAGAVEIVHAFWTKGWGGFIWQILLGLLYGAFGVALFTQPVTGALVLTYFLGFMLVASGVIRVLLSFKLWKETGWMMLLSGLLGIAAGLAILTGYPSNGLWIIGFLLGIDLIFHGLAWILYAIAPANKAA
jgi:uncharacterized membrane protein HdeD (DUF308 family)